MLQVKFTHHVETPDPPQIDRGAHVWMPHGLVGPNLGWLAQQFCQNFGTGKLTKS